MSYQSLRSEATLPTPLRLPLDFNRFALQAIVAQSAAVTRPSAAAYRQTAAAPGGPRLTAANSSGHT